MRNEISEQEMEKLYAASSETRPEYSMGDGDYDLKNGVVVFIRTCRMCGNIYRFAVRSSDYERWVGGALIQDAFPYIAGWKRELLKTRTCDECWKRIFNDEEE